MLVKDGEEGRGSARLRRGCQTKKCPVFHLRFDLHLRYLSGSGPIMHDCLRTLEVVRNVADLADEGLVCLVLSCRSFYEPCMDAVWRDVPSPWPLLNCFPAEVGGTEEYGGYLYLCSAVSAEV